MSFHRRWVDRLSHVGDVKVCPQVGRPSLWYGNVNNPSSLFMLVQVNLLGPEPSVWWDREGSDPPPSRYRNSFNGLERLGVKLRIEWTNNVLKERLRSLEEATITHDSLCVWFVLWFVISLSRLEPWVSGTNVPYPFSSSYKTLSGFHLVIWEVTKIIVPFTRRPLSWGIDLKGVENEVG